MNNIKRILLPTDFSEDSGHAVAIARDLSVSFKAEIDLIHIVPSLQHFMRFLTADMNTEYSTTMLSRAEEKAAEIMSSFDPQYRGETFIRMDKKPGDAILEHIESKSYDLIIVGAKGGDKTKMRRGSIALQVIKSSKVPVLAAEKGLTDKKVKHILVPTDASELSFTALSPASVLAGLWDASITLLFVSEIKGGLVENVHIPPEKMQKESVYKRLLDRLESFMKKSKSGGLALKRTETLYKDLLLMTQNEQQIEIELITEVKSGFSSHYEIENYAENNSDLVVMATHGYSGFAHMFLGSVTEKVLQHVNKPVMTVRPYEADFLLSKGGLEDSKDPVETLPPWHWIDM